MSCFYLYAYEGKQLSTIFIQQITNDKAHSGVVSILVQIKGVPIEYSCIYLCRWMVIHFATTWKLSNSCKFSSCQNEQIFLSLSIYICM